MKKILFMLTNMNIGGTEKSFLSLVSTLSPSEYDVTLLLLEKTGGFLDSVPDWVHIKTIEKYDILKPLIMNPPLQLAKKALSEKKILHAFNIAFFHTVFKISKNRCSYYRYVLKATPNIQDYYDIAIAYAGPFDFITIYVLDKINSAKKIQWIHFDVAKFSVNPPVMRECYPKFDKIYTVSDEAREHLIQIIPEISNITSTKYNIVSKKMCKQQSMLGQGYEDDYSGTRILTVGRLSEEKGQDIIPEIVYQLKQRDYDFRWYLIGDGQLRPFIINEIKRLHIENNLVLLGTQKNPYPYYRQSDIYVQTSLHEGYCITLAEAKVFDLPIVSTDFVGAHEQLDGRDNSTISDRNIWSLTDSISNLMQNNF